MGPPTEVDVRRAAATLFVRGQATGAQPVGQVVALQMSLVYVTVGTEPEGVAAFLRNQLINKPAGVALGGDAARFHHRFLHSGRIDDVAD